MKMKFKKFEILTDERQFIFISNLKKKFYPDFESLLRSIPNNLILKAESKTIEDLLFEIRSIKNIIEEVIETYAKT